jgi:hypothetical protein
MSRVRSLIEGGLIFSWALRGKGEARRDSGGPFEESDPFFKFQCVSGFGICHVRGAHIFTRQPSPSTLACTVQVFQQRLSMRRGVPYDSIF